MATKRVCDRCGAEISPVSYITYAGMRRIKTEVNNEDYELCVSCAYKLRKWFNMESAPAADVAPVVYGRWIRPHWKNNNYCCGCSECGGEAMHRDYQWHKNGVYPICPNCGAKMDGRE